MNRTRLLRSVVPTVAVALAVAAAVHAYTLLTPRRTWDSPPAYIVDNRGVPSIADGDFGRARTRNAIVSAVAWNGAGTGTRLTASVGSVADWRLGDGRPMIVFRDTLGTCTGSCLAATFTGYYSSRGNGTYRIDDADVVTNIAYNWMSAGEVGCTNEPFIESAMVHEVGHGLGLGHSSVSGATMYPSISTCSNTASSIEADDETAIRDLY